MKRLIRLIFISLIILLVGGESFANPIDIFIGQLNIERSLEAVGIQGKSKRKVFILYHGDRVVIERNSKTGKSFLVGVYSMTLNLNFYPGYYSECIIPVKRMWIRNFTLNVNINDANIKSCL